MNALAKYTHLADLDPLSSTRVVPSDRTMEVVSIDTAFQATRRLEWVSKVGTRHQTDRIGDYAAIESNLRLAIQRLNVNVYRRFDFGVEYRMLDETETSTFAVIFLRADDLEENRRLLSTDITRYLRT